MFYSISPYKPEPSVQTIFLSYDQTNNHSYQNHITQQRPQELVRHLFIISKRSLDHFPLLRLQRLGSIAIVQPVWEGEVAGPSLTCDLETGTIALAEHPPIDKNYTNIFGVIGLARFEAGPALIPDHWH